jgi:hypothetical protein
MPKTDWEITATTIYCDDVDDEVTLIVHADGTCRCTGSVTFVKSNKKNRKRKLPGCSRDDCPRLKQYRDSLIIN